MGNSGTVTFAHKGDTVTTPDPTIDPTAWFEHRYQSGAVPWDRDQAHDLLVDWAPPGTGRTAIVVGCGIGHDAEHLTNLGYDTIAFDASTTAIRQARERYPDSKVHYLTGDLLNLPEAWRGAYDLVVEIRTVQSLPLPLRTDAISRIGSLVAPGGTLFVVATIREEGDSLDDGPPWPLTKDEVQSFANETLTLKDLSSSTEPDRPEWQRWHAIFTRAQ